METNNYLGRLCWVDVVKGFTMLLVILGHLGLERINIIIYSFHMPMFFILAGYFQKDQEHKAFVIKKSKSLLVPYLFTGIVQILATQINNIAKVIVHRDDACSATYLIKEWTKAIVLGSGSRKDTALIQSDFVAGGIWFLLALFFAQAIVNLLVDKNKRGGVLLIVIIAIAGIVSAKFIWLPLSIQAGAAASIYVTLGYIWNEHGRDSVNFTNIRNGIICCSCIWMIYLSVSYYTNNILGLAVASFKLGVLDYIGSVGAVVVVLYFCYRVLDKIPKVNSFLQWFGKNSLIVLCFHNIECVALPFQSGINYVLNILGANYFWLSVMLTFVVKVLWSCLAIIMVYKSRTLRWIFNIKEKSNNGI